MGQNQNKEELDTSKNEIQRKLNVFEILPVELIYEIFLFLEVRDLILSISYVNRHVHNLSTNEIIYRSKLKKILNENHPLERKEEEDTFSFFKRTYFSLQEYFFQWNTDMETNSRRTTIRIDNENPFGQTWRTCCIRLKDPQSPLRLRLHVEKYVNETFHSPLDSEKPFALSFGLISSPLYFQNQSTILDSCCGMGNRHSFGLYLSSVENCDIYCGQQMIRSNYFPQLSSSLKQFQIEMNVNNWKKKEIFYVLTTFEEEKKKNKRKKVIVSEGKRILFGKKSFEENESQKEEYFVLLSLYYRRQGVKIQQKVFV